MVYNLQGIYHGNMCLVPNSLHFYYIVVGRKMYLRRYDLFHIARLPGILACSNIDLFHICFRYRNLGPSNIAQKCRNCFGKCILFHIAYRFGIFVFCLYIFLWNMLIWDFRNLCLFDIVSEYTRNLDKLDHLCNPYRCYICPLDDIEFVDNLLDNTLLVLGDILRYCLGIGWYCHFL